MNTAIALAALAIGLLLGTATAGASPETNEELLTGVDGVHIGQRRAAIAKRLHGCEKDRQLVALGSEVESCSVQIEPSNLFDLKVRLEKGRVTRISATLGREAGFYESCNTLGRALRSLAASRPGATTYSASGSEKEVTAYRAAAGWGTVLVARHAAGEEPRCQTVTLTPEEFTSDIMKLRAEFPHVLEVRDGRPVESR